MANLDDFVLTSKGPRHRSQVHRVRGGSRVRRSEAIWQIRSPQTTNWRQLETASPHELPQPATGGWISWADWRNMTQVSISRFVATWQVPPAPTKADGQLIYLFNGLQDANGQHILQPVLQWGASPAQGSGNAWGLASFWVGQSTDPMFCSEWVEVASGVAVTGRITVATLQNGFSSCTCEFDGFPGTQLTAENLPSLVDCVLTLEAYNTGPDAPYPNASTTDFTAVALDTGEGAPAVTWTGYGSAVIKANGDVEVVYPS